ncbi:putative F-box/LRR-repeat protein [Cocos nucifera]|nr:putative F-box/LRR-repeat protein [Cocos nucifera]
MKVLLHSFGAVPISGRQASICLRPVTRCNEDNNDGEKAPFEGHSHAHTSATPRAIVRFHCVSKQWRSLLSSSYFHNLHRFVQDAKGNHHFFISPSRDRLDLCLYAIVEENDNIKQATLVGRIANIVGGHRACLAAPPCEGVVCHSVDEKQTMTVCNPTTHEVVCIPVATPHHWKIFYAPLLGLGVDSVTKEHKLVRLFTSEGPDFGPRFECKIYTLGSTDWRPLGEIPYLLKCLSPALVNGALHWITLAINGWNIIVAFDLHEERF